MKRLWFFIVAFAIFSRIETAVAEDSHFPQPPPYPGYNRLLVPKLSQDIKIDGDYAGSKWAQAAEIGGFLRFAFAATSELLPEEQATSFKLMCSDEKLYVAMRSRNFPLGAQLKSDQKNNRDKSSIVLLDHFEIQFSRDSDPTAALKKHFYKFIGNHLNSLYDQKAQPSVGQDGMEWDAGADFVTKLSREYWDMELGIPFRNMDEKNAPEDFETWLMWLVRAYNASSSDFFMWCGRDWNGWDAMPRMTFHSKLVSAQLKSLGEPLEGRLDLAMNLVNFSDSRQKVYFNVNYNDRALFDRSEIVEIAPGKTASVSVKKDGLPNAKGTFVTISVWVDGPSSPADAKNAKAVARGPVVIYQQRFSLTPKDEKYKELNFQHVKKYRDSKIGYKWNAAYLRTPNFLLGELDMDFDGIDPRFLKADKWVLSMTREGGAGNVFSFTKAIKEKKAAIEESLKDVLSNGVWRIESKLLSRDGATIDAQSYPITVAKQPWEGCKSGIDDEFVPPPYTPVKIEKDRISVIGREYVLDSTGLPKSIVCEGQELLSRPIVLEAIVNGKPVQAVGKGFTITERKNGKLAWTSEASLDGLSVKMKNWMEYDGSLFVGLEFTPKAGGVQVDALKLRAEFNDFANMCMPYRSSGYTGGSGFMFGPEKTGILWESAKSRPPAGLIGSFNPTIYIGSPARGLWWFCKGDKGWILDDAKSSTIVSRNASGNVQLEQLFINKPATIHKVISIPFMMQAVPPKPLPANWREVSWGPQRIYGSGSWADGYYSFNFANPDDWKTFAKWPWHNKPIYVATELIGRMVPGLSTYCGEWTGDSKDDRFGINNALLKVLPDKKWRNACGMVYSDRWEERASNYFLVETTQSLVDCRVWAFEQGVKNGGLRGYWWDMNTFRCVNRPEIGMGYVRDDGVRQGEFNYFEMRDLFKRMYHIAYINGVEPENWHYPTGVLGSFQYGSWLIEGKYYMYNTSVDLIAGAPKDIWPISAGRYAGSIPQMCSNFHDNGLDRPEADIRPARAALTLCFLNDFGAYGINDAYKKPILEKLKAEGFFSPEVKSVLHWSPQLKANVSFVTPDKGGEVLSTVYTLPGDKLMLVIGNMGAVDATGTLRIQPVAFNSKLAKASSLKWRPLEERDSNLKIDAKDKSIEVKNVFLASHDFKIFILEGK